MKRLFALPALMVALLLAAPGINTAMAQSKTKKTTAKKAVVKKAAAPTAVDIAQGKALLAKSDCLTCHKEDMKLVGPAYIDVAKKYPATAANYALLTKKVIEGGSGVWGQIPMTPHPAVPAADVKKMIVYILSLKTK